MRLARRRRGALVGSLLVDGKRTGRARDTQHTCVIRRVLGLRCIQSVERRRRAGRHDAKRSLNLLLRSVRTHLRTVHHALGTSRIPR